MSMSDHPIPSSTPLTTTERQRERALRYAEQAPSITGATAEWRPQGAEEAEQAVAHAKAEKKKSKKTDALQSKDLPNFDYMFFIRPSLRTFLLSLFPVAALLVIFHAFFADALLLPIWVSILILSAPLLGDTVILGRTVFVWRDLARAGELRKKKYRKEFPLVSYTLLFIVPSLAVDVWYWPLALVPFFLFAGVSVWGRLMAPKPPYNIRPEEPVEI